MDKFSKAARFIRWAFIKQQLPDGVIFESVAAVRLFENRRLRDAIEFARSDRMEGRTIRHSAHRDDSLCWEFELFEDAVLFRLKFDGASGPPLDIAHYLETGSVKSCRWLSG